MSLSTMMFFDDSKTSDNRQPFSNFSWTSFPDRSSLTGRILSGFSVVISLEPDVLKPTTSNRLSTIDVCELVYSMAEACELAPSVIASFRSSTDGEN